MMNSILVVIPAYNEADHIGQVVTASRRYLPVLVVDDGSTDDTAGLAEKAGAMVLRQVRNQGKGAALRLGFFRAINLGYAAVITLDADGQHDPQEIPQFMQAFADKTADLIIGRRSFNQMPLSRRVANTVGGWLFTWALGRTIPDNQSGYRLLSRRLMQMLLNSQERGFEFEVEMIAICLKNSYCLDWVPVRTIYAGETSHIHPLHHILNFMRITWTAKKMMS